MKSVSPLTRTKDSALPVNASMSIEVAMFTSERFSSSFTTLNSPFVGTSQVLQRASYAGSKVGFLL